MNRKLYCCLITLVATLLCFPLCAGTSKTDSLITLLQILKDDTSRVNTLNLLGKELFDKKDFELGLKYVNDAKILAEKLNYNKGIADALTNEGLILSKKKQYKKALTLHKEALKIQEILKDEQGIRYSYYHIGSCYQWLNLYTEASSYFFKSRELAEAVKDSFLLYKSLSSTAYLLQFMGNINESVSYQLKAIEYISSSHKEDYCIALIFLADYYALCNEPGKADSVLKIAYHMAQELKSAYHLSYYYNIKSEIDAQRNDFGQAILSLINSNKYEAELPASANLPYNYANIANYILKADKTQLAIAGIPYGKKYDEVIRYAQNSLDITIPAGIIYITSANYYHISIAYKSKGDSKKALQYFELHKGIQDSLFNVKNMETIQELKLKYETKKKEQQINLLEREKEINNIEALSEKQKKNFAFVGIAALFVMGGYIFMLYSKRIKLSNQLSQSLTDLKKTQEQLIKIEKEKEAEKTRLTISRDLHDDLGATLSSISVYSAAAKQRLNNNNIHEAAGMLDRISTDAQEMAASVSERVWMMKPENITIEKVIEHLQLFASSVLTAKNISFYFNCDEKIKQLVLSSDARKNIYLIFKEAINNAAKYSEGREVKLNASVTDNKLAIVLSDNGKGFDRINSSNDNNGGGRNGLKNMQQRASEINAQVQINSSTGNGTSINFLGALPIIEDKTI